MTGRDEKGLPGRWRWGAIGDPAVATLIMGQSPPGNTYNTDGRGLPFFQGKADFGEVFPTERVWCTAPKKIAEQGDILLSVRAPVGPTNLAARQCCIGRGLAALRGGRTALTSYLYYWFKSIEAWLSEQGEGSTFTAIGKERIESLKVPLPPLPVQERIVQILQKADEIRRKRREALELADTILPSIYYEMFGDLSSNPKAYDRATIGQVTTLSGNERVYAARWSAELRGRGPPVAEKPERPDAQARPSGLCTSPRAYLRGDATRSCAGW